ncbi:hypothetical protein D3C80_1482950 [compost metagenome]
MLPKLFSGTLLVPDFAVMLNSITGAARVIEPACAARAWFTLLSVAVLADRIETVIVKSLLPSCAASAVPFTRLSGSK